MPKNNSQNFRLGVDFQSASQPGKSGVGYYTLNMVLALAKQYPNIDLYLHIYNFFGKQRIETPTAPNIHITTSKLIPLKLVNLLRRFRVEIPFELLLRKKCDAYFFPNFISYPVLANVPVITAIHDLAYIELPESVSPRNQRDLLRNVPASLKRSTKIATISEATANQIKKHYPAHPDIFVTHLAPTQQTRVQASTSKIYPDKYILFVGNLEPRKNLVRLLEAYSNLPTATKDTYSLIIVGGHGWNNEAITTKIETLKRSGCPIAVMGYVPDSELVSLYSNASLFVFPSLYEGFGLPPLDAMTYGVPVVASNIPVLKEVCADAVEYCDPNDSTSITLAINRVLSDTSLRKTLTLAGRHRVAQFSWAKAAKVFYNNLQN